ncbi:transglutaminase superfamily protein [Actinocorallia herbida]|uniref:Transglutaminase superfamily protein n=1 Tax=Actinocorallia herbida TaxID=58109 RepID=A0A3N1CRK8_9ACTN|nr:DUF3488 and transglutaminase-like domain-containing protein [Actinocorallia herbida]ROO83951.1 transglutaminase superfamily protein [Actinocorallia herbida]
MKPRPALAVAAAAASALAATSLVPLFQDRSWALPALGAIAVVALAGAVVRRFRLPPVFTLVGAFAALHLYLTAYFTGAHALLWVIPTTDSISEMLSLLREGRHTAQTYAAPLPVDDGVRIIAAFGVGLVAATVDLLAVRLRRAAPAGLPLLAMYSVPVAVPSESVSWISFALGAGGYLVLLAMEARERVGAWGRTVPSRLDGTLGVPRLPAGKRVALAAIGVAVGIPALLPGLGAHGILDLDERRTGGSATITTADPLVDLKRKLTDLGDTEVLRYTTDDPRPDYLRIFALDKFEEERWTYSPLAAGTAPRVADGITLPRVPGLSASAHVNARTEITIGPDVRDMKFLALPYAPRNVSVEGDDWRVDRQSLMVYSTGSDADGLTYSVVSRRATPTAAQLRRASGGGPMEYTRVPELPAELQSMVQQITAKAKTQFDRALAIQRWFTREFTYSLEPAPPTQLSDLMAFLNDRRGYCEQFAATMALMTRSLGIPTRVVVGYAPGTRQPDGSYLVKQRDAHAWPELYFEGTGWVRFEPTPGGTGAPTSVGTPDYTAPRNQDGQTGQQESGPQTQTPVPSASDTPSAEPTETAGTAAVPEDAETDAALPFFLQPLLWLLVVWPLLLIGALPRLVREGASRLRWRRTADPATAAWAQLRADSLDHALGWQRSESPRAVVARLGPRLGPTAAQPLARIALAQELARYAPPEALPPQGREGLREDAAAVRSAMSESVPGPASVRARVLPASSLDAVRRGWTALRDALARRLGR